MKLLNPKSFILLMSGFGAYFLYLLTDMVLTFVNLDALIAVQLDAYAQFGLEINAQSIRGLLVFSVIFAFVIVAALVSIFIVKALSHRKTPKTGAYLTVLLVFAILYAVSGFFSLIGGNYLILIAYAGYGLLIAAVALQKSGKTPFVQPPAPPAYQQPFAPPNGNPYQQNPYQNPYRQEPNPYQQQQSPYRNPYRRDPNPYQPDPPQPPNPFGSEYGENGQDARDGQDGRKDDE
ncbi:MAG: hypothetical protein LBL66_06590 [Clostridiales bacterium]|jgi:hypothetical protein|nr:hypothetical protein [Clostridiales bacterium]